MAYREAGSHVPSGAHRGAPAEGHVKATLTVYVTRDVRRKIHGPHRRIGYCKNYSWGSATAVTLGTSPQSIQGQSNSRWTTSLGITLAQPHAVVRASPILAGTGSFIHLPDKEFRYLRTVIVTAAVYRGFISELAPLHLTFRHRAGVSPYTSAYALAETCVFSKQSDGPFLCGPRQLTE